MIFSAVAALVVMPCAAQNDTTMPERMQEQTRHMQEKMSQHFHRTWSGMREAMHGRKGAGKPIADASMDLREQSDAYVLRLHLPERDIARIEASVTDGRTLRVLAPATDTLGAYEQSITLEGLVRDAKPEIEKRPGSGMIIIRVAKEPSEKKLAPEASNAPVKSLPEPSDPWDVKMLEHMKRMGREMDDMLHNMADETPHGSGMTHRFDKSSFDSAYDLQEEGDRYVVRAYLPERRAGEVKVSVREQMLVIEAVAEKSSETKDGKTMMRHMSEYTQMISLPGPVDDKRLEIERKEGVITIRIPKAKEAGPSAGNAPGE